MVWVCKSWLNANAFVATHQIGINPTTSGIGPGQQRLQTIPLHSGLADNDCRFRCPVVYVFAKNSTEPTQNCVDVVYVGKGGRGIKERLSQHKGGFVERIRRNPTHQILTFYKSDYIVWVRCCNSLLIGSEDITLYSVEEHYYYNLLVKNQSFAGGSPLSNRDIGFPKACKNEFTCSAVHADGTPLNMPHEPMCENPTICKERPLD